MGTYIQLPPPELAVISRFQRQAPVDVIATANALGMNVWEQELGSGISGKLFRDSENGGASGYSILVNAPEPLTRKRFTIAHEISHFILHRNQIGDGITDDTFYRSGLSTAQEAAANKLAADIIMPFSLINALQRSGIVSVEALAESLGVSKTAMMIRLGIPTP
jgi:IrrE N-terminal-like domain